MWQEPRGGRELGVQGTAVVQRGLVVECTGGLAEVRSAEAACREPWGPHGESRFRRV